MCRDTHAWHAKYARTQICTHFSAAVDTLMISPSRRSSSEATGGDNDATAAGWCNGVMVALVTAPGGGVDGMSVVDNA